MQNPTLSGLSVNWPGNLRLPLGLIIFSSLSAYPSTTRSPPKPSLLSLPHTPRKKVIVIHRHRRHHHRHYHLTYIHSRARWRARGTGPGGGNSIKFRTEIRPMARIIRLFIQRIPQHHSRLHPVTSTGPATLFPRPIITCSNSSRNEFRSVRRRFGTHNSVPHDGHTSRFWPDCPFLHLYVLTKLKSTVVKSPRPLYQNKYQSIIMIFFFAIFKVLYTG